MGACCTCLIDNDAQYKEELTHKLIEDDNLENFPEGARVLRVSLLGMRRLPPADVDGTSDPYLVLRVRPEQEQCDDQECRSSYKNATLDPRWEPPERFQFVISDPSTARLILSVYDYDKVGDDDVLGDAMVRIQDYWDSAGTATVEAALISPENGLKMESFVDLQLQFMSKERARNIAEHFVYEYERWSPAFGWGSTPVEHLLPTDPGKWSTISGEIRWSNEFDEVAPPLPDGWEASSPWSFSTTQGDPEGWQYAGGFVGFPWYDEKKAGSVVRRRLWKREAHNPATSA